MGKTQLERQEAVILREIRKRIQKDSTSLLALECRLAHIRKARQLWLLAARRYNGDLAAAGRSLGIESNNVSMMLKSCFLTREYLKEVSK